MVEVCVEQRRVCLQRLNQSVGKRETPAIKKKDICCINVLEVSQEHGLNIVTRKKDQYLFGNNVI